MHFKLRLAIIFIFYYCKYVATEIQSPCTSIETCALCIQNPSCAWCSQSDFHGNDKKPLSRCNSVDGHAENGGFQCNSNQLFQPRNAVKIIRNDSLSNGNEHQRAVPIRPQKLLLKMRVGDPIMLNLEYKEVEDYPLDLYYLMDGTYTMKDDQEVLVGLGDAIGQRLRKLTSKFRQGFGTFVDKVTMPYVVTTEAEFNNPCYIKGDVCVPPYGFKNQMQLSNDTKKFSEAVNSTILSASSDLPEGGFDALMQVMVCDKLIGWSSQARRLVIFATDARYHIAGDGRLGGMLLPNDGKCHLDENGEYYTDSLVTDYPSIAQINQKAKENSVNVIFAVTNDEYPEYEGLLPIIEGSKSTELARNSSNIVDLVVNEYKKIQEKIEMKDTFPSEYFKVTFSSNCLNKTAEPEVGRMCEGLEAGSVVRFQVSIELIKCPDKKLEWKQQYRIYAVGVVDGIEIDVEKLCNCPCEDPQYEIPNSRLCTSRGTEVCGLCKCKANFFGKNCECSADGGRKTNENTACKLQENSTEICSGRGTCDCGQCKCFSSIYSGPFCECDNSNCRLVNGLLCADHGTCDCGTCQCATGWEGEDCSCSTNKDTCIEPGSSEECNGQGRCVCGKCKCKRHYSGEYCEKCMHENCPNKCEELKHCVQCKLYETGIYNPSDCGLHCYAHVLETVDILSRESTEEQQCKGKDPVDNCDFIFSYTISKDKRYLIRAQKQKECPAEAPIFWIVAALSGIVAIVGVVLLCAYLSFQKIRVKREFAAYEKERLAAKWTQEHNPIYNNPVTLFNNPSYGAHAN